MFSPLQTPRRLHIAVACVCVVFPRLRTCSPGGATANAWLPNWCSIESLRGVAKHRVSRPTPSVVLFLFLGYDAVVAASAKVARVLIQAFFSCRSGSVTPCQVSRYIVCTQFVASDNTPHSLGARCGSWPICPANQTCFGTRTRRYAHTHILVSTQQCPPAST